MKVGLKTQILPADEAAVAVAARCLREGGLVAFPTETVYGLGADAANAAAVARLYEAKGRPSFNPLIAHVADLKAARQIARFDATATRACGSLLAGAADAGLAQDGSLPGRGIGDRGSRHRCDPRSAHPVAQSILRAFGGPVVAPSANLSGHVSPTTAAHVAGDLTGRVDLIIDGGPVECRRRIHHHRLLRYADAAAAGRTAARSDRARARPRACSGCRKMPAATTASRWRRACWLRIMRRARRCG